MREEEKAAADAAKEDQRRRTQKEFARASRQHALPEISFSTFLLSLGSTALVQLGEVEDPVTQQLGESLPNAKQTIDILGVLEEKTRGNLSDDEAQLLSNLLYDLRMRYVSKLKSGTPSPR
ncbi:MAG: DUF1844 domain-containing protein [Candidatus Tectomicrobia bacterium]|nr:DUF1844 domain-containing protein [Candidatus Tectomicrobia bacterium]